MAQVQVKSFLNKLHKLQAHLLNVFGQKQQRSQWKSAD